MQKKNPKKQTKKHTGELEKSFANSGRRWPKCIPGRGSPAAALSQRTARRGTGRLAPAGTGPLGTRRHDPTAGRTPARQPTLPGQSPPRRRRLAGAAPRGSPALPSPAAARRSGCTSCTGSPATCRTACAPSAARSSRGCGSGHTWADAAASSPPRRRRPRPPGRPPCGPPPSRSLPPCPPAPRRPRAC